MEKNTARPLKNQNKKIFLIAFSEDQKRTQVSSWITKKFEDAAIFTSTDPADCLQKIRNATPTVLITNFTLSKSSTLQTLESLMADETYAQLPIVVVGSESQKADYMDAVVTGKVQFLDRLDNEQELYPILNRALNFSTALNPSHYQTKYLSPGDILIKEGEKSEIVYILKKGQLVASKMQDGAEVVLGSVYPGEFVGEMGFLNGSVRVATVKASEDSQVVSIPVEIFESVIFKRPSWSKQILATLSKRLSASLKK